MNKLFLLLPAAAAGIFLTGCVDEPYQGRVANGGPAYYRRDYDRGYDAPAYDPGYEPGYADADYGPGGYGPSDEIDFYYEGGRPYSRYYGPLIFRDNRYYSSRGGSLATYDVDFGRHHGYGRGGDRRGGYGSGRDGYNGSRGGGYSASRGGSNSSRGGYTAPQTGRTAPRGGYTPSQGHGGYTGSQGGTTTHSGYPPSQGGHGAPHGGYTGSQGGGTGYHGGYPPQGGNGAPHGTPGAGGPQHGPVVQRPGGSPQKGNPDKKKDDSH